MLHISLLIYPMMQYSSTAPQTPSPKINQFVIGTQNKTMWLNEQCEYRINIARGTGCDLYININFFIKMDSVPWQHAHCWLTEETYSEKNEIQPWNIQWIYLHNHCIPVSYRTTSDGCWWFVSCWVTSESQTSWNMLTINLTLPWNNLSTSSHKTGTSPKLWLVHHQCNNT